MSSIYLRNGIWQIQYIERGRTVQKSLRTRDEVEALQLQAAFDSEGPTSTQHMQYLLDAYMAHCRAYYAKNPSTARVIRQALFYLEVWHDQDFAAFGPLFLEDVRDTMIREGLCRTTINKYVGIIQRMFRWAASKQLVDVTVYQALATLEPLKAGRSKAKESAPVEPVEDEVIDATMARIATPWVHDVVALMRLTGARPGEILGLTGDSIDRTGEVWTVRLRSHKTAHRGKERALFFGPRAQEILAPLLLRAGTGRLFCPKQSVEGLVRSMGTTVTKAAQRAGVTPWHPNQIRHSVATRVRAQYGLEGAQVVLGHATANVTQVYAERDMTKARSIIAELG